MALPPFLNSVIQWLRAGYPEGVPDVDYVPLFALLGSQLSESDVKAVAEELANMSKPESAEAIRKAITMVTDHTASDADVARVRSRLAAGRWPSPSISTRRTGPNPPAAAEPIAPAAAQSRQLGPRRLGASQPPSVFRTDELVEPRHRLPPSHGDRVAP
jgi:hypothetical protein